VLGNYTIARARRASRGQAQSARRRQLLLTCEDADALLWRRAGQSVSFRDRGIRFRIPGRSAEPGPWRRPATRCARPGNGTRPGFAGFSTHEPWLPCARPINTRNVAVMRGERRVDPSLARGLLHYRPPACVAFRGVLAASRLPRRATRLSSAARETIARSSRSNFGSAPQDWTPPPGTPALKIAISTYCDRQGEAVGSILSLRPAEGVLLAPGLTGAARPNGTGNASAILARQRLTRCGNQNEQGRRRRPFRRDLVGLPTPFFGRVAMFNRTTHARSIYSGGARDEREPVRRC